MAGTEQRLKVRWLPLEEFEPERARQYVALKLSPATGFDLHACLPEGLFHGLLQGIDPAQFWQMDELLRCACLQVRNNGVLEWLNRRWQCRLRVDGVTQLSGTDLDVTGMPEGGAAARVDLPEHPPRPDQALVFRLRTAGGLDYPPALLLPGGARQPGALSALHEAPDNPGANIAGERAPLRLDVITGHTQAPVAALRELQVDDIIVLEAGEYAAAEALLCVQGRPLFAAEVKQNALQVKQFLRSDPMANTETSDAGMPADAAPEVTGDAPAQADNPESLQPEDDDAPAQTGKPELLHAEDINVTLHFSLGSLTRTLAEINRIAEGDLLELPRNVDNGVDILVNGKRLATGEPVRIEDRMGIRVVKVSNG